MSKTNITYSLHTGTYNTNIIRNLFISKTTIKLKSVSTGIAYDADVRIPFNSETILDTIKELNNNPVKYLKDDNFKDLARFLIKESIKLSNVSIGYDSYVQL